MDDSVCHARDDQKNKQPQGSDSCRNQRAFLPLSSWVPGLATQSHLHRHPSQPREMSMVGGKNDPADWKKGRGQKTKKGEPARATHWAFLWPVFQWVSLHTWLPGFPGASDTFPEELDTMDTSTLVNGMVPGLRSSSPSCPWSSPSPVQSLACVGLG